MAKVDGQAILHAIALVETSLLGPVEAAKVENYQALLYELSADDLKGVIGGLIALVRLAMGRNADQALVRAFLDRNRELAMAGTFDS